MIREIDIEKIIYRAIMKTWHTKAHSKCTNAINCSKVSANDVWYAIKQYLEQK